VAAQISNDSSAEQSEGRDLRTTDWRMVLSAGAPQSPAADQALERLCRLYWFPIYAFIRRRGYDAHEAQDLTQDFFAHLLEDKILKSVDPVKGKFRSFLLVSLKNLLANDWHRKQALKRGGQCAFFSWDEESVESRYQQELSHDLTPEKIFDQTWASVVLAEVRTRLRMEYETERRGALFDAIEGCLCGEKAGSYAEVGSQLSMTEGAIKMAALRLRKRYRELLLAETANTVCTPDKIEEEIRSLLACVSG